MEFANPEGIREQESKIVENSAFAEGNQNELGGHSPFGGLGIFCEGAFYYNESRKSMFFYCRTWFSEIFY